MLFPAFAFAQNFEGEIVYKITLIPKADSFNLEQAITDELGDESRYIISGGRYKSSYYQNGEYTYSYTYSNKDKRMYDDYVNQEYITFRDSQRSSREFTSGKLFPDSTINILGYEAFLYVKEDSLSKVRQYYAKDIKVDPDMFKSHKAGDWYNTLKRTNGSLNLKTTTEYSDYIKISEAIKVEPRSVDRSEFALPDKPTVAANSALDKQVELNEPTEEVRNCYREKLIAVTGLQLEEPYRALIALIIDKKGNITHAEALNGSNERLDALGVDIMLNCSFSFTPGQINGKAVGSKIYFPIPLK
jgi:hypothetical protein